MKDPLILSENLIILKNPEEDLDKKFSIYILQDPETQCWRYVGKTYQSLEKRFNHHLYDAKRKLKNGRWEDNTHRACWIRSLLSKNKTPTMIEIIRIDNLQSANLWEKFFIRNFRKANDPRGKLTNFTDGGDGGNTRQPSCTDEEIFLLRMANYSHKKIGKTLKTCPKRVAKILKKYDILEKAIKEVRLENEQLY